MRSDESIRDGVRDETSYRVHILYLVSSIVGALETTTTMAQNQGSLHDLVVYLRTLPSIRERCTRVHDLAQQGRLQYFDYHPEKEGAIIEFCASIIEVRATPSFLLSTASCPHLPFTERSWAGLRSGKRARSHRR